MWIRVVGEPADTDPIVRGLRDRGLSAEAMAVPDWKEAVVREGLGTPGSPWVAHHLRFAVLVADRFTDEVTRVAGDARTRGMTVLLYGATDTFRVAALAAGVEDAISARYGGVDELAIRIRRAMTPDEPARVGLDDAIWLAVQHTFQDYRDASKRLQLPDREAVVMDILLRRACLRHAPAVRRDLEDALGREVRDQAVRTIVSRLRTHLVPYFGVDPLLGNLASGLCVDPDRVHVMVETAPSRV